ncbi:similar to peroxisomal NADH pyrophosphatase NUDT12 [Plenodomus lingam JN3]|uniref:NAD(+) diphosphatase n=2 Tax=Leptosphaeria maculans TaxID=5022 RepID=E5A9C9_LEPMJ|nr:similar to peroxisomal NADH pyrophosphatase NUDT12 [Plenodomus lingam JN3]CBY00270.1 similar to peroxisomal NADH pyrophosphatase NUDT12 [Plenodomus lingam JN3]
MPSLPQPDLPAPAHPTVDSMLSRKFGKEVANYFSGSPLNRVSFLRNDHTFLSSALKHPSSIFLAFNGVEPLLNSPSEFARLSFEDVKPVIGENPFERPEEDMIAQYNSSLYLPQIIFLGLDERKDGLVYREHYKGQPWFAVDVTPKESVKEAAEKVVEKLTSRGFEFSKSMRQMHLVAEEAAIYAEARHLLDWNARNPFCASCGYKTLSVNAGFKRTCPPKDIASAVSNAGERPPCATRTGISNLCFPRTDPTVIMAVVSADGQRMLLGRQKRWPPYWYSTLAGFLEPAESVEEAVRREVWEESGIHLGRVVIHSTQPWPFPANLMIGAIGQALPTGETVHLGHDAELEDARWFSAEEVREGLRVGTSALGEAAGPKYKEGGLRLPPSTAIANQLITAIMNGFASGTPMI